MAGSRNRLWLGGRHPALPNLKRSLRRAYRGEKSLAHLEQIRLTPFVGYSRRPKFGRYTERNER